MNDPRQETILATDRIRGLIDATKRGDDATGVPIAIALAGQVLGALFSIAHSLATIAAKP